MFTQNYERNIFLTIRPDTNIDVVKMFDELPKEFIVDVCCRKMLIVLKLQSMANVMMALLTWYCTDLSDLEPDENNCKIFCIFKSFFTTFNIDLLIVP